MSTQLIVGFFKNSKSYYATIWDHIKGWKDAKQAIGVRFQKYEVPVYHRGVVVLRETRFRAIATFINHEGKVISRQCSSKGWPLYQVQETAPHTKYFKVFPLEGSKKSGTPRDYFTSPEGCTCPAFVKGKGLIDGFCKHQLMIADEIGINEPEEEIEESIDLEDESNLTPQEIEDGTWWPYNGYNRINRINQIDSNKSEDEVDINKFASASLNFGLVKPKPQPKYKFRLIKSNKSESYFFFNLDTQKYLDCGGLSKQEAGKKAYELEREGHKIDAIFKEEHWILLNGKWVNPREARVSLGV